jgi:uncharacterized protein (DUF4415 family)
MAIEFGRMTKSERVAWEAAELERKLRLRVELKATRGIHVTVEEERARLALWNRMENWELAELEFDARGMILPESLPERLGGRSKKLAVVNPEPEHSEPVEADEKQEEDEKMAAVEDEDAVGSTKVTIRLDNRIIAAFRALGPGYQAKINDALLRIVKAGLEGL